MAISQARIASYSGSAAGGIGRPALRDACSADEQTAFLCHASCDVNLAEGIEGFVRAQGWTVRIDLEDQGLGEIPTKEDVERLRKRIRDADWFLYLATENSVACRWCQWALGYADGAKKYDSILIIPTKDRKWRQFGLEFLRVYRHVDQAKGGGYGAFDVKLNGRSLKGLPRS